LTLSDDLCVAVAPASSYRDIVSLSPNVSWARALARPALFVLLVGTSVAMAATGRVSLGLVASTSIAWCWVVGLQLAIAVTMVGTVPTRRDVTLARGVELWFAGHVPWTLWILFFVPVSRLVPGFPVEALLLTMTVPIVWTMAIAATFCRIVLGRSARESWWRAAGHQVLIVSMILSYVAWSAGGWFRLIG
jgi:hypothetical protein